MIRVQRQSPPDHRRTGRVEFATQRAHGVGVVGPQIRAHVANLRQFLERGNGARVITFAARLFCRRNQRIAGGYCGRHCERVRCVCGQLGRAGNRTRHGCRCADQATRHWGCGASRGARTRVSGVCRTTHEIIGLSQQLPACGVVRRFSELGFEMDDRRVHIAASTTALSRIGGKILRVRQRSARFRSRSGTQQGGRSQLRVDRQRGQGDSGREADQREPATRRQPFRAGRLHP